jgi:hypothetical protein
MANQHVSAKDQATDLSVLNHIRDLVAEEQRLYEHNAPSDAERERMAKIKVELDQYWDLLRQRRALEEFGRDPAEAQIRAPSVVENYKG